MDQVVVGFHFVTLHCHDCASLSQLWLLISHPLLSHPRLCNGKLVTLHVVRSIAAYLKQGLSTVTTPISISAALKSTASTLERAVMATSTVSL